MRLLPLVFLALGCAGSATPTLAIPDAPEALVELHSAEGRALVARNLDDADLPLLLEHYESQRHRAFCGVASSVIVLNALAVPAPDAPELLPFHYHTQETFFLPAGVEDVTSREAVSGRGMTLDQLGGLLRAYGLTTRVVHGADVTLDAFRDDVRANVEREGDLVLVNYHRPAIGQEGGGHVSPIAAYDDASDRMLVLDVARYRYPPIWIRSAKLWEATRGIDSDSGLTRGVVYASRTP